MDVTRVGGMLRFSELIMDFREQGGRALVGGLMAPQVETTRVRAH